MELALTTSIIPNDTEHTCIMHTLILPAEKLTRVCTPICRSILHIIFKCDSLCLFNLDAHVLHLQVTFVK